MAIQGTYIQYWSLVATYILQGIVLCVEAYTNVCDVITAGTARHGALNLHRYFLAMLWSNCNLANQFPVCITFNGEHINKNLKHI